MHLHDQSFVLLLSFFGLAAVHKHKEGGYDVTQGGEDGKGVGPRHVVVVRVQKPVSVPAGSSENANGQE